MTTANINTEMLMWARERSGFSVSEFAKKCGVPEERLQEWEMGKHPMTFNQAMTFAEKAHIPFGYLFLQQPPVDELPIPDLRTVDGKGVGRPSAALVEIIKLMQLRQEWYRDHMMQQLAEPNPILGRFSPNSAVQAIVQDMRGKLGVPEHPTRGTWEHYYRDLVQRIEACGILVMRQGDLGHFTRPLSVDEFRGFAMVDSYAPLLFVNDADAPGARLFTLIHELCHVWIGQSGISDGGVSNHRQEETLCNAVAAEFLVPASEFRQLWRHEYEDWQENLAELEAHFHVSTWVLARRAQTLGYISQEAYFEYVQKLRRDYKDRPKKAGGPDYYKVKNSQISHLFSRAVVSEALSGQLLLRDASHLLGGIKPGKIAQFARELG
ncbi:XRE family transcriptional regulator [Aeromonas enteropelogenes]|uniref:XRE family transcriptional regulator n=1 Tax=Aeromonas enteropelogenes TaxID=29489 RepID=UPI0022868765|nr:XRE family transcriptional regulator [Aeromonas enteropelogenes]MCZ0750095.1 XRE family transcriptional regulator [Aeromonas enteropelogenes]